MNEIEKAIELMLIGLAVVFINLYLVVLIGKLIIKFVNRFVPDIANEKIKASSIPKISSKKLAAITSAVNIVTLGKGRIKKVEKVG